MGRNSCAGQKGDPEHAAAAAGTGVERVAGGGVGGLGVVDCGRRRLGWRNSEQLTAAGELGGAMSIRRFGAKSDKNFADVQAASPSSWKTPCMATLMVW